METGVGMTVSRAHLADSVWNSVLRVDGMPEQRSKPEAEPDLLIREETAARCGLMTHWPGVFRSAERSPFMSPQRPTARDLSSCGATTSTMTPLDKTVMPCSGTWTETTPSWNIITKAAILPWTLLDNLANDWVDLLTVDKNLEGRALWDNLGLSDTG